MDKLKRLPLFTPANSLVPLPKRRVGHSLSDWDFMPDNHFALDDALYYYPPYSLSTPGLDLAGQYDWVYLKPALGLCVPHGRLITWLRLPSDNLYWFEVLFRAQALPDPGPPPDVWPAKTYRVTFNQDKCHTTLRDNGAWQALHSVDLPYSIPPLTWVFMRVSWHTKVTANLATVLSIIVEKYFPPNWEIESEYNHDANLWADSAINLVGMVLSGPSHDDRMRIDETEIWKRENPP